MPTGLSVATWRQIAASGLVAAETRQPARWHTGQGRRAVVRVQGGGRGAGDRAGFRLRAVVEWVIVISIFGRDTWRCPGRNYAPYSCSTPPMVRDSSQASKSARR